MKTKELHYLSGLLIALFVGLHLFNHFTSIYGAQVHIQWMNRLRVVYRNPIIEVVLLSAVVVQIVSGIHLFRKKRRVMLNRFGKLQIWTGMYLALFLVIHVSAVLVGRFILNLDTNFYFGVAGINTFPFSLFFVPYYFLAVVSFSGHIAAIHAQKMPKSVLGVSPKFQSLIILLVGCMLSVVLLFGATNHFKGQPIPSEYDVLIGK